MSSPIDMQMKDAKDNKSPHFIIGSVPCNSFGYTPSTIGHSESIEVVLYVIVSIYEVLIYI